VFFFILKLIGLTLLSELLRPKPVLQHAKPSGFDEFGIPTADPGRAVPVIFGRVRQRGVQVLWYGNYSTVPMWTASKVKGLFKSKTYYTATGYRYFISAHLGLADRGVQNIHGVWVDERQVFSGSFGIPANLFINQPTLFGGPERGGGLVGNLTFYPGGPTQLVDPHLAQHLVDPPGFRHITSVVLNTLEVGESPNLRAMSFEMSRYPSLLGFGAIGLDANPAEIVYEVLRDPDFGLGASVDAMDTPNFQAVAATLLAESFGLSLTWDQSKGVGDFIEEAVLRPIDGVLFPDLRTTKLKLKLIRDDYDESTLPILDPSNSELVSFQRTEWAETFNEVRVLFTSRASAYQQGSTKAFDAANFDLRGLVSQRGRNYPGVNDSTLASKLAWRDLRAIAVPLAKAKVRSNRAGMVFLPGDVFLLRGHARLRQGEQIVMRVANVNPGAPGRYAVEMECFQDVFSLGTSAFASPPATEWTDPVSDPEAITLQRFGEVPYLYLLRDDGSAARGAVDPDEARIHAVAVRPNTSTTKADLELRISPNPFVADAEMGAFAPSATLVDAYPASTDFVDGSGTLLVEDLQDGGILSNTTAALIASELRNIALLDGEIISWETITDNLNGTWTLNNAWRGLLDTLPVQHSAGARLWFSSEGQLSSQRVFAQSDSVDARLIPVTPRGELDSGLATIGNHVVTRRSFRPLPPGNLKLNGAYWPEYIEGELALTWAHRDRTAQSTVIQQGAGNIGPEAGVTYTLRIYDSDNVLIRTESGLTGTSYTYTQANEIADSGEVQNQLRFELESLRAGFVSYQKHDRTIQRVGWGLGWGVAWGAGS
jgi:hypothetical protein